MNSSTAFMYHNPMDMESTRVQGELQIQHRGKKDPDKPPGKKRGDKYVIIGAVVFCIIGGFIGSFFGFFTTAGGLIIGGILGTYAGDALKKYILKRRIKKEESSQIPKGHGEN
ncbi:hypothetical protein ACFLYQ_02580 [Chloroflexota bacterium]